MGCTSLTIERFSEDKTQDKSLLEYRVSIRYILGTSHLVGGMVWAKKVAVLVLGIPAVVDEVVATAERVKKLEMGEKVLICLEEDFHSHHIGRYIAPGRVYGFWCQRQVQCNLSKRNLSTYNPC